MRLLGRWWVLPPVVWGFMIVEFLFTIPVLTLFGIADPDTYKTKLWQEGADHGWNSNPNEILYSYANHRPIQPPLVWSEWLNTYNVVISVLAMFILLTKCTMMVLHLWIPFISILVHILLIVLFSYSAYAQASHDLSDPKHPQPGSPWYITKSCSVSNSGEVKGYCEQAKAAFALTIVMAIIFFLNLAWAVYSNFFGRKPPREEDDDDYDEDYRPSIYDPKGFSPDSDTTAGQQWEMQNIPSAYEPSNVPYTPRTQAFNQLGGQR